MGTKKRGSEMIKMIFNLQWKNSSENGRDKSNLIGVYDTPTSTNLNFTNFKSYLLKNSGVAGDDVKVSYLSENGPEWTIRNQAEFQIALCAFRQQARLGETINLQLEKMSGGIRKISSDAETQIGDNLAVSEAAAPKQEGPPEWFLNYMVQFKRDIVEEITFAVSSNIVTSTQKDKEHHISHKRVHKAEPSKRSRKHGEAPIDKELLKTLKYDRKLEIKLDKLDAKTKKIKEKKQALAATARHLDQEDNKKSENPFSSIEYENDGFPTMNAAVMPSGNDVTHLLPGDVYLHKWEVINNGKAQWTPTTELRLTWGSAEMKPMATVIRCPLLKPFERAAINVRFVAPDKPGRYESYWNFFDGDVRFGRWLSCCIIVDPPIQAATFKKPKIDLDETTFSPNLDSTSTPEKNSATKRNMYEDTYDDSFEIPKFNQEGEGDELGATAIDLSKKMRQALQEANNCGCSNKYGIDENDLLVDLSNCKISDDLDDEKENVVGDKPVADDNNNNNRAGSVDNNTSESISEIGSVTSLISSGYDVISEPICDDAEDESGYVYITIDGNKLSVPKHILRPDIVATAEKAPEPKSLEPEAEQPQAETEKIENNKSEDGVAAQAIIQNPNRTNEDLFRELDREAIKLQAELLNFENSVKESASFMTHCSTTGTCFSEATNENMTNSRLFIFPQNSPGYEVVNVQPKSDDEKKVDNKTEDGQFVFYQPFDINCPTNKVEVFPTDPLQTYTWARSQTQYTTADVMQNVATYSGIKYDPYGPLDNSRPTSSQSSATTQTKFEHIPNFQQTLPQPKPNIVKPTPEQQDQFQQTTIPSAPPRKPEQPSSTIPSAPPPKPHTSSSDEVPVHILPENLVSGAVNVASSAINTARSVINMIVPKSQPGRWVNGHYVIENPESKRGRNLRLLSEMGFWDTDLNATLLARYNDDVARVISELVQ